MCNYLIGGVFFILNNMVFLGLAFMLIYVGAVSILLLFTLMLLNLKTIYYKNTKKNHFFVVIYAFLVLEVFCFIFLFKNNNIVYNELSHTTN